VDGFVALAAMKSLVNVATFDLKQQMTMLNTLETLEVDCKI
jgi:hypothetical protein